MKGLDIGLGRRGWGEGGGRREDRMGDWGGGEGLLFGRSTCR